MATPEGRVKDLVRKGMAAYYRFMPVQNGMGAPGLDFYYCAHGLFVAVETKVPGAKLTARQRLTAEQIAASGGLVFVIREAADVVVMLQEINRIAAGHNLARVAGFIWDRLPA